MIKRLVIGAALGVLGKKLYDEGRLDPYLTKAKKTLNELGTDETGTVPRRPENMTASPTDA